MLSGGERRRLALAAVVASGANFLVLDEPTNHLDLESREALEDALRGLSRTVLLVSHDRALLDAVAERTLAIEDGALRSYDGGWADYVRRPGGASRVRTGHVAGTVPGPVRKTTAEAGSSRPSRSGESVRASSSGSRRRSRRRSAGRRPRARLADDWNDVDARRGTPRDRDELRLLLDALGAALRRSGSIGVAPVTP